MNSFLKGLGILFLIVFILALFIPIGHGTSLGELFFYTLKKEIIEYPEKIKDIKKQRIEVEKKTDSFYQKLSTRFAGTLVVQVTLRKGDWQQGSVNGVDVWLDDNSGIIWQNYQGFTVGGWGVENLKEARQYCQNIPPKGYWSLPTNAEFALGVKSKMHNIMDDIKGRWIAQSYSQSLPFPEGMPTLVGFKNQGLTTVSVRCVARTHQAPVHGYIRDDISNADVLGLLAR